MSTRWWFKMVNEILDDPKIARMSDGLFRAFVLLLAAANEAGEDGRLPELDNMSWRMRIPAADLQGHLDSLTALGCSHKDKRGRWWMTNFARRQAPATPAERQAHRRELASRGESRNVTANVTELKKRREESEPKISTDKERRSRQAPPPEYPSSKIFRDTTHRWPAKALQRELHEAIGDTPEALDLWKQVVRAWIGLGWNPMNTDGMLDYFKRNEIPHLERKGDNGRPAVAPDHDYFVPASMRVYPDDCPKPS
jgi:hypothetical protein